MQLFDALSKLSAYCALNNLANFPQLPDLQSLAYAQQFLSNINSGALNTLFDCMINWLKEKELIWNACYNFFSQKILTRTKNTFPPIANFVIISLYDT